MTDLRDAIARALHRQATDDGEVHVLWGGVSEHEEEVAEWLPFADAVLAVLADHDAKVRAEALQEAADRIEPAPVKPENPYSYDPWDDDSVDPTNLDDVTRAAILRGWESGEYAASVSAHMILTAMVAVTRGEAS